MQSYFLILSVGVVKRIKGLMTVASSIPYLKMEMLFPAVAIIALASELLTHFLFESFELRYELSKER